MDIHKIWTVLCSFILIVCLTLCISTLVVLRHAIAENGEVQSSAKELVEVLDGCVAELGEVASKDSSISTSVDTETEAIPIDSFVIREVNGKVGVYTVDGILLKILDVSVDSLPQTDRGLLSTGITVKSWRELLALIQDYMD